MDLLRFKDEISNHVWPGLLDVYTYYGSDRTRDSEDLAKRDIVLTTYQTVTADSNKVTKPSFSAGLSISVDHAITLTLSHTLAFSHARSTLTLTLFFLYHHSVLFSSFLLFYFFISAKFSLSFLPSYLFYFLNQPT